MICAYTSKLRFGETPLRLCSGQAPPTRETRALPRNAAERRFYDDVLMKRDEDKIEIKVA
jgi:hypothetical protein